MLSQTTLELLGEVGLLPEQFQYDAIHHTINRDTKGLGGLLALPCGYGKTLVAMILLQEVPKKTLWVTASELLDQAVADLGTVLDSVVLLRSAADFSNLTQSSVGVISTSTLSKLEEELMAARFERVIVDEVQNFKAGKNNYPVVDRLSNDPQIVRWGLSATPYNNSWEDLRILFAWVTGDQGYLKYQEETLRQEALADPPGWYKKAEAPALEFKQISRLIVLPYLLPAETRASMSDQCIPPKVMAGKQLAAGDYGAMLLKGPLTFNNTTPKTISTRYEVHQVIEEWVQARMNPTMALLGAAAAHCSAGWDADATMSRLTNSHVHLPTKVMFVVAHANEVHPDRPVVVVYDIDATGDALQQQFSGYAVAGNGGKSRRVLRLAGQGKSTDRKAKAKVLDMFKAAIQQDEVPPVLVAQAQTFNIGTDGLQKWGVNVMYQTSLSDNPQRDVQGASRIFRRGQTQSEAFLYRIMVDSYPEKRRLQRQVLRAGGWRQRVFNPGDACMVLDIPKSWEEGEPEREEDHESED